MLIGHKCHGEEAWKEKSGSQKQGRKRSGKQIEDVTKKEDQTRRGRREEKVRQGAGGRGGEDNMAVYPWKNICTGKTKTTCLISAIRGHPATSLQYKETSKDTLTEPACGQALVTGVLSFSFTPSSGGEKILHSTTRFVFGASSERGVCNANISSFTDHSLYDRKFRHVSV